MPGNGYPMRLLLPGYEGNMNVKFLRRIKLVDQPAMSMYESRTYSQILPDGKAYRFYFLQEVKSFITSPSHGMALKGPGLYEISGIAYSGTGRIEKVMVSADGGKSWGQAALQEPVLSRLSRASACRGAGMAARRRCKAARGTRPEMCSRPAPSSLPSAAN
jgi:sulfane dehydrogenase subunit SoxC